MARGTRGGILKTPFEIAERRIPVCVTYDPFQVQTVNDILFILQHEVDLFEEGQDSALSKGERNPLPLGMGSSELFL